MHTGFSLKKPWESFSLSVGVRISMIHCTFLLQRFHGLITLDNQFSVCEGFFDVQGTWYATTRGQQIPQSLWWKARPKEITDLDRDQN